MNDYYLTDVWRKAIAWLIDHGVIMNDSMVQTVSDYSYILSLNENTIVISCQIFLAELIINEHREKFEEALASVVHHPVTIKVIKGDDMNRNTNKKIDNIEVFYHTRCDKNYNFENFIVGRSNIQAQVSALTVANNPGLAYNPLFIYGNSGLGKTHLLNAIGNKVRELFPHFKIGFISGLDFVEGVASSIKNHTINDFKKQFQDLDILLVDDIQFIAGKEKTHEIFFSIFNGLVNAKKQICLTCDRLPKDIEGLEERIISRFNQGLNVNIEAPEYETSINILKKKLTLSTIQSIDDDVLSYIATNFSQDVRQLEGALNRLLFYAIDFASTNHITLDIAMEAFQGQVTDSNDDIDINIIKKAVCNYYGVTKQQLNSKIRTKNIAIPRQIAMYLCRKYLDLPYKDIGYNFGKRDHSTVINACDRVEEMIRKEPLYQKAIQEIEKGLK